LIGCIIVKIPQVSVGELVVLSASWILVCILSLKLEQILGFTVENGVLGVVIICEGVATFTGTVVHPVFALFLLPLAVLGFAAVLVSFFFVFNVVPFVTNDFEFFFIVDYFV